MSTSSSQLVLDIIVSVVTYWFFLCPLTTRALEHIYGEPLTPFDFAAKTQSIKAWIDQQFSDNRVLGLKAAQASAALSTETTAEPTECDRCCGLFEDESSYLRWCCGCTWCAVCVESSFETALFEGHRAVDKPLEASSKRCPFAQKHTIREMLSRSESVLSTTLYRHIERMIMEQDTLASIDMEKNDWMLESDEDEEIVKRRSLLDFSPLSRESW